MVVEVGLSRNVDFHVKSMKGGRMEKRVDRSSEEVRHLHERLSEVTSSANRYRSDFEATIRALNAANDEIGRLSSALKEAQDEISRLKDGASPSHEETPSRRRRSRKQDSGQTVSVE